MPKTYTAKTTGKTSTAKKPRFDPKNLSATVREGFQTALRVAATAAHAPKDCRRQACRHDGRCHLRFDANGNGGCAGPVTDVEINQAALMIRFLMVLGKEKA